MFDFKTKRNAFPKRDEKTQNDCRMKEKIYTFLLSEHKMGPHYFSQIHTHLTCIYIITPAVIYILTIRVRKIRA